MYRVTQKITDAQAQEMIGGFCRTDGGCLKRILWPLAPDLPITTLPAEKFQPAAGAARAAAALPRSLQSPRREGARSGEENRCTDMIIRARTVVTMDGPPIENGAVAVEGNRIVAVGHAAGLALGVGRAGDRSRRAGAAAGPDQRALPSRLHDDARRHLAAEAASRRGSSASMRSSAASTATIISPRSSAVLRSCRNGARPACAISRPSPS